MRNIDLTSWQGLLGTLLGLALVTIIGVGIRLLVMSTVQRRRERMNRQINERLRALIAAYKTLGGSFTGDLSVDPRHRRDLRGEDEAGESIDLEKMGSDRARRIRDAVEASLSDIFLLGTEEHVRLAERAARELVAGKPVHTHELVVALRDFIREALDLDPIPEGLQIPMQGPARPSGSGGRDKGDQRGGEGRSGGGGMEAGGGMALGGGIGLGGAMSIGSAEEPPHHV
ncbi:hypothetical protein [Roseomonas populi]|uniref:Secreted protein n=1 Tax=Roseomonas populi TaxID=3121582 RepID=A0ABT1X1V6_9PROT|nr:hypothetical protein [Roseomonas pecuniae]MCR0982077.1 hypothetical protein [Roseomonas pecuniae]